MRFLILFSITIFIALTSVQTQAKVTLANDCKQYSNLVKSSFILFSKQELISLGECVAQDILRKGKYITTLVEACNEVKEANGMLGIAALSKAEAIKIGQCIGAINFVDSRFHGTKVYRRYNYSTRSYSTYVCTRGKSAIALITESNKEQLNTTAIRNIICESQS